MDLYAELVGLVGALDAAGVPYAVCGALALAVHGVPRATKDLDILVPAEALEAASTAAATAGFTLRALPMRFASSGITVHRLTKVTGGEALTLDVIVADAPLAEVWRTRLRASFREGVLWVVSKDGLVTMKLAAGRAQDLADVERLAELHHG